MDEGDLPFDRTMKITTAEDQADKDTIAKRIPANLETVRKMLARNQRGLGRSCARRKTKKAQEDLQLADPPPPPPRRPSCWKSSRCGPARSRR